MLRPYLPVSADRRGLLARPSTDDHFLTVGQVSLLPKNRDGHVLTVGGLLPVNAEHELLRQEFHRFRFARIVPIVFRT